MKTPKEEFIELMAENVKANGLDELSAKIIALVFIEPEEISLEDISLKAGYSLSAVSTALKLLESTGLVNKHKRPHSKKVYLSMEKSIMDVMLRMLRKKQDSIMGKSKEILPNIIEKYKKSKSSKDELAIIENYYKDVIFGEKVIKELIEKVEKHRA
jgi:HTH-type transcriptional regulator, osmoprotectant uptake regulator